MRTEQRRCERSSERRREQPAGKETEAFVGRPRAALCDDMDERVRIREGAMLREMVLGARNPCMSRVGGRDDGSVGAVVRTSWVFRGIALWRDDEYSAAFVAILVVAQMLVRVLLSLRSAMASPWDQVLSKCDTASRSLTHAPPPWGLSNYTNDSCDTSAASPSLNLTPPIHRTAHLLNVEYTPATHPADLLRLVEHVVGAAEAIDLQIPAVAAKGASLVRDGETVLIVCDSCAPVPRDPRIGEISSSGTLCFPASDCAHLVLGCTRAPYAVDASRQDTSVTGKPDGDARRVSRGMSGPLRYPHV